MMIQYFAEKYKLKTSRDECGEVIVRGKRGHLYTDGGKLCAMWTDAPPMKRSRLAELGGTVWQGDIGRGAKGRRVQDAWVRSIRPGAYRLAIWWAQSNGGPCHRHRGQHSKRRVSRVL
jgi:hypothetical protein